MLYGPKNAEVAATLGDLGNAWHDLGQPDTARWMHQRALEILEREYGPDRLEVASTLSNLGNAWFETRAAGPAAVHDEPALRRIAVLRRSR